MEIRILENGQMVKQMGKELIFGQMEINIKEIGLNF